MSAPATTDAAVLNPVTATDDRPVTSDHGIQAGTEQGVTTSVAPRPAQLVASGATQIGTGLALAARQLASAAHARTAQAGARISTARQQQHARPTPASPTPAQAGIRHSRTAATTKLRNVAVGTLIVAALALTVLHGPLTHAVDYVKARTNPAVSTHQSTTVSTGAGQQNVVTGTQQRAISGR